MTNDMTTIIRTYNDTELLQYLQLIENEGNHQKVMEMCTHYVYGSGKKDCTTLMLALTLNKSKEVISKLIEIGGRELVMVMSNQIYGYSNALHYACMKLNISNDIVLKLIEVGGRELVMMNSILGTALHCVCKNSSLSMNIVSKLIDVGGSELVNMRNPQWGETALHEACKNQSVFVDVISKLVEVGGRDLVHMKDERYGFNPLHRACQNKDASIDVVSKLIEVGGPELVLIENHSETALHYACSRNESMSRIDIVSKLIEVGGRELVMMNSMTGTALHFACNNVSLSIDIVSKLIEVGGPELVNTKNLQSWSRTALHEACKNKYASIDIISKLIEVGGRDLVHIKDQRFGFTALHEACQNENASIEIVSKLIEVGGQELVLVNSDFHGTALNCICYNENVLIDIVTKLIDVGGRGLFLVNSRYHGTVLHSACKNRNVSIKVASKLIEVAGRELLMAKNEHGDIPLYLGFFDENYQYFPRRYNDTFTLWVKECILANIGGEFGIGGLFHVARQEIQNRIYDDWEELSPALNTAVESFQEKQPLILHAAILAKAPLHIIQNITRHFEYSALKTDSYGRYAVEVALEENLGFSEGLQDIVKATTLSQHQDSRIIQSAARHGLKWRHHMKELAEMNVDEIMGGHDSLSGLRLFMVAAMGDCYDLSSIYGMMKMCPEINDVARPKKRKLK